jgi:uncharacterized membrane-anchored protein
MGEDAMKYGSLAVLFALGLSAAQAQAPDAPPTSAAEFTNQIDALGWVHGPATVSLGEQATVHIPKGVRYLDPANTRKFLELNGNPPSSNDYTIAPET